MAEFPTTGDDRTTIRHRQVSARRTAHLGKQKSSRSAPLVGRSERRGRTRSDVKRAAILRAAKAVFLASGFEGANMDDVAAKARVSKMTVYRHFGSKEELFAGVTADVENMVVEKDLEHIFSKEPEDALRHYARKMIDIVFDAQTIELHRIVVAEVPRMPALGRSFYSSGPQVCIDVLARYLAKHRTDPRFRVAHPKRTAEEFLELLRGYGHLRVLLKIDKALTSSEIKARIDVAVGHVLNSRRHW